jgi:hypothetical protein
MMDEMPGRGPHSSSLDPRAPSRIGGSETESAPLGVREWAYGSSELVLVFARPRSMASDSGGSERDDSGAWSGRVGIVDTVGERCN